MRYLVEFDHNWADEFNVHGLAIMTPDQYAAVLKYSTNVTYNFGSNEGWENDDLSSGFRLVTNVEGDIAVTERLLNFSTYGTFKTWGNFPDIIENLAEEIFNDEYDVKKRHDDDAYDVYHKGKWVACDANMSKAYDLAWEDFNRRYPEFSS